MRRLLLLGAGFVLLLLVRTGWPPPARAPAGTGPSLTVIDVALPEADAQMSGAPGVILVEPAPGFNMDVPGDTLAYNITWGAGARATGYAVTVNATPSTGWLNLPNGFVQTGTVFLLRAVNTAQPDVNFTVTVCSRKGTTTYTNKCAVASWAVTRVPGPPGIPTIDSSMTIVGMRSFEMLPEQATVWRQLTPAEWTAWDTGTCQGCTQAYRDSVHTTYAQHAQMQFCSVGYFTDNSRYPLGITAADSVYCINQVQLKYPGWGNSPNARAMAKTICINYSTTGPPGSTITNGTCQSPMVVGSRES